jgi:hypothetical protein
VDTMSVRDIWLVAIPEISLSILFGLLLINKQIFKKKNRSLVGVLRFIVSVIMVLVINYYSRATVNNVVLIIYCTTVAYSLTFSLVWRNNLRQSLLVGLLITYLIMGAEFITLPLMSLLINKFQALSIFSIRFLLSIPSRVIDAVAISGLMIYDMSIQSKLFDKNWSLLKVQEKITTTAILILFTMIVTIAANNSDMFVKLNQNGIDTSFINNNLQSSFYGVIFFMIVSVVFFYTIIKYCEYRDIALKTPRELFTDIAEISSPEKINDYIDILQKHLSEKEVK